MANGRETAYLQSLLNRNECSPSKQGTVPPKLHHSKWSYVALRLRPRLRVEILPIYFNARLFFRVMSCCGHDMYNNLTGG